MDLNDFRAAIIFFNLSAKEELVVQLFRAFDADHDRLLSYAEFVNGASCTHAAVEYLCVLPLPEPKYKQHP